MAMFLVNIIVILFSGCCIDWYAKKNKKIDKKKWYLILAIGYLTLLAILRSTTVGIDTARYYRIYTKIAQQADLFKCFERINIENGFILYCYFLSRISSSPRLLLIVSNTFMFFSVGRFFYKHSEDVSMSVYMFFTLTLFDFFLSGLRQSIAIAILLYAYDALLNHENKKFLILVIIAAQFHTSAIIFLVVYFIYQFKSTKTYLAIAYGLSTAFFLIWPIILKVILLIIPRYSYYLGDSELAARGRLGILFKLVMYLIIILGGELLKRKKHIEKITKEKQFLTRLVFGLPAIAIVALNASVTTRLFRYLEIFLCIFLPNIISQLDRKDAKKIKIFYLLLLIGYALIIHIFRTPSWQVTYPYTFFWQ